MERKKSFLLFGLSLTIIKLLLLAENGLGFSIPDENCSNEIMYEFKWQSNPLNISKITGWNTSLSFSPFNFGIEELNAFALGIATDAIPLLKVGFGVDYLGGNLFSESLVFLNTQSQFFRWFSIATRLKTTILRIENFGTRAFVNSDIFAQYEGFENFLIGFRFNNLFVGNKIAGENQTAGFGFRFKPDTSISTGFDINFILGYSTSYSVNISAKAGNILCFEASFTTLPQFLCFGISVNPMHNMILVFYLSYNNYLTFSQKLGLIFKF